ncbi:hypothetical protein [Desulfonatronum parangueonense]
MSTDPAANLKLRVFISSAQKELEEERMQLRILLTSDPFLLRYTVPKLFEKYPAGVLTLPGPDDDLSRIKAPASPAEVLPKSVLEELNERQLAVLELAVSTGSVTNRQIQDQFKVVKDTALRDLTILCQLNLLEKQGQGRSTRYVPQADKP